MSTNDHLAATSMLHLHSVELLTALLQGWSFSCTLFCEAKSKHITWFEVPRMSTPAKNRCYVAVLWYNFEASCSQLLIDRTTPCVSPPLCWPAPPWFLCQNSVHINICDRTHCTDKNHWIVHLTLQPNFQWKIAANKHQINREYSFESSAMIFQLYLHRLCNLWLHTTQHEPWIVRISSWLIALYHTFCLCVSSQFACITDINAATW